MKERGDCRLCGSPVLPVFDLVETPIANDYRHNPDFTRFPLGLCECMECYHVQQRYVMDNLYEDYKYTTPKTVARYLGPVAKLLKKRFPNAKTVLEIGSNNGTYLEVLREAGFDAIGVDPAATGDCNNVGYFSENWAKAFNRQFTKEKKFDLIVANNVFAHIDDMQDVLRGVTHLLKPDGSLVFEVQYLKDLVETASFDMIYHEHMSYHMVEPLKPFLRKHGLIMTRVDHLPLHGGSIRITASRLGKETTFTDSPVDWEKFKEDVDSIKTKLKKKLEGKKVVGFGAAAKATTLIHHCGIAENILFIGDDTPQKQGCYIPGTLIEICKTDRIKDGDTILMFAWNYEREIRERYPNSELIHPFAILEKEAKNVRIGHG